MATTQQYMNECLAAVTRVDRKSNRVSLFKWFTNNNEDALLRVVDTTQQMTRKMSREEKKTIQVPTIGKPMACAQTIVDVSAKTTQPKATPATPTRISKATQAKPTKISLHAPKKVNQPEPITKRTRVNR